MPGDVSSVSHHEQAQRVLRQALDKHGEQPPLQPELERRGLGAYRGYRELLWAISELCSHNGRGPRLAIAGHSVRGEPIVALHPRQSLSHRAHPHQRGGGQGCIPSSWIGIETSLALVRELAEVDLGDRSLVVFPLTNPDGLLKVERNLRRRRNRFVRHNARGVDLNRNFDARWGHKNLLARLVPWVFKPGSYPASEPEVASIAYLLGTRRVDRSLSLHSFGGVVLYPSSHSVWPIADVTEHRHWAQTIGRHASNRPYWALPSSVVRLGHDHGRSRARLVPRAARRAVAARGVLPGRASVCGRRSS